MSAPETITVDLGAESYPIVVGADILDDIGTRVRDWRHSRRTAVVTDANVGNLYGERVEGSLEAAGLSPFRVEIPPGEEHKNLAWLALLYDRFIEGRLDRRSTVMALGGGVVGDLAGYAAATFLRGLPFVQVPTTLLAQVDSSVGGKTGINHAAGKNLIGAFHQPRLVWIDVHTLRSLPEREVRAGIAEVIKYGVILSPELFRLLEGSIDRLRALEDDLLVRVVRMCCELKAMVVATDERESGYRAILNFGHTVGHAIEMLTEYRQYLHGEAVAMGMVAAAAISHRCGLCSAEDVERIRSLVRSAGLPDAVPRDLVGPGLVLAMEADKKRTDANIRFVALQQIGRTRFVELTPEQILRHLEEVAG